GSAGIIAATAHLGRPWLAFRGVLGWKHSWLSREVIAFATYLGVLTVHGVLLVLHVPLTNEWRVALIVSAALAGWCGVYSSVRIYQFTHRAFWAGLRTSLKFWLTTLLLGLATAMLAREVAYPGAQAPKGLGAAIGAVLLIKLLYEC